MMGHLNKIDKELFAAVKDENISAAEKLLAKGIIKSITRNFPNINAYDEITGSRPLGLAVENDDIEMVKLLLNAGADVNARDPRESNYYRNSALHFSSGNIEILKLLLNSGANVNAMNFDGYTCLWWAAQDGNVDAVKLLIDKGAEVNPHHNYCPHPLGIASYMGHIEIVKLLLENGADVNFKNVERWTAMCDAASQGNREIVELLFLKGTIFDLESRRALKHVGYINAISLIVEIKLQDKPTK